MCVTIVENKAIDIYRKRQRSINIGLGELIPTTLAPYSGTGRLVLVILVAGGSVMALSPTARAAVMGWLFGQEGTIFSYTSMGE